MSVNREEIKRMIDRIPEQDAQEVLDFIGYLNMKREKNALEALDVEELAHDQDLIRQARQSQQDRREGRVFRQESGLEFLRSKAKDHHDG